VCLCVCFSEHMFPTKVSVPAVLHTLGLVHDVLTHRDLPFARDKTRSNEGIRPVHWANRPDA
jgi:hypothetical protein